MTSEEKLKKIERIINVNYAMAFEIGIPLPDPIKQILRVINSDSPKQPKDNEEEEMKNKNG
jgi:tryptophan synthase alpha subunit